MAQAIASRLARALATRPAHGAATGGGGGGSQIPANTSPPTITRNGLVLTCKPGTWTGNPTLTYRWTLNGTGVVGATSATWSPPASAWGALFSCAVVGTNAAGAGLPALAQAVYIGILDVLSVQPLVAHYARRARAGYAGPALPVRRETTDPASQDALIPFTTTGVIDETALLAHCGSGSGFGIAWPNQMGDASYDAKNDVGATQPRIVNAGVVEKWNGAPVLDFVGASDNMFHVKSIDTGNLYLYSVLKSSPATAIFQTIIGSSSNTFLPVATKGAQSNTNAFRILGVQDPPGLEMYLNGSQTPVPHNRGDAYNAITRTGGSVIKMGPIPLKPGALTMIGQVSSFTLDGPFAGLFWFLSPLPAADEAILVQNQMATWAIPA